jgi:hypothetical protein
MTKKETSTDVATITQQQAITKLNDFSNVEEMKKWATIVIDSGLLPSAVTEPEQVITIVQHGKELGLSPHIALNNIHVISGRPTLSHTMLGTLLKRKGVEWVWDEDFESIIGKDGKPEKMGDGSTNKRTTIHLFWKSPVTDRVMETTFSVTWAQMVLAGFTTKDNWKRMPKEMMRARCMTYAVRALFPEVLGGFYTDIEIADVAGDNTLVTVNEEGEIEVIEHEEIND